MWSTCEQATFFIPSVIFHIFGVGDQKVLYQCYFTSSSLSFRWNNWFAVRTTYFVSCSIFKEKTFFLCQWAMKEHKLLACLFSSDHLHIFGVTKKIIVYSWFFPTLSTFWIIIFIFIFLRCWERRIKCSSLTYWFLLFFDLFKDICLLAYLFAFCSCWWNGGYLLIFSSFRKHFAIF